MERVPPHKLICPKCGFSKFYPAHYVGDLRVSIFTERITHCPKFRGLLKYRRAGIIGILERLVGLFSSKKEQ